MCCVNCRSCEAPSPGGWLADPDPDPIATQPLPDPQFRGPNPWKQEVRRLRDEEAKRDQVAELERLVALAKEQPVELALNEAGSKPPKVLPRSYLMWLAVDLDGTLAEGIWTPEEPTSEIGEPIWPNVAKVRELAEKGWKIVIHTARPWHDYEAIEVWANHYRIPFSRIVCGKLLAAAYIDDRAIDAADPDWTPRGADARTEA